MRERMALILDISKAKAIQQHACETFPEECCGCLLGHMEGDQRRVFQVVKVSNTSSPSTRRTRFFMDPKDIFSVEEQATRLNMDLIGFYHSHPDGVAEPSNYDLRQATWERFSHVILTVRKGNPGNLTSWVLREDRAGFIKESITIMKSSGAS